MAGTSPAMTRGIQNTQRLAPLLRRHCERSEAIHRAAKHEAGSLRYARDDGSGSTTPPHSRGAVRPSFASTALKRGRRECRVRVAPAVSRAKCKKHTRSSPQVHRSNPAFPAQWFNGLLRDLPGDRALLSPSSREYGWAAPGRADFASARLDASVEASGPHDFTVRTSIVRPARLCSLTGWTPPCDHDCAPTPPRLPHPAPRS